MLSDIHFEEPCINDNMKINTQISSIFCIYSYKMITNEFYHSLKISFFMLTRIFLIFYDLIIFYENLCH